MKQSLSPYWLNLKSTAVQRSLHKQNISILKWEKAAVIVAFVWMKVILNFS